MCLGPYKNDPDRTTHPRQDFILFSLLVSFGIYSTLLSILLCVFNDLITHNFSNDWEYFYLNPLNPGDLKTLNCIILSLLTSGASSMILFRFRSYFWCFEKIVEKAEPGQVGNLRFAISLG